MGNRKLIELITAVDRTLIFFYCYVHRYFFIHILIIKSDYVLFCSLKQFTQFPKHICNIDSEIRILIIEK